MIGYRKKAAAEEDALRARCLALGPEVYARGDDLALNQALARVMDVVGEINGYLERTAPRREAKAGREERVATILSFRGRSMRKGDAFPIPWAVNTRMPVRRTSGASSALRAMHLS